MVWSAPISKPEPAFARPADARFSRTAGSVRGSKPGWTWAGRLFWSTSGLPHPQTPQAVGFCQPDLLGELGSGGLVGSSRAIRAWRADMNPWVKAFNYWR